MEEKRRIPYDVGNRAGHVRIDACSHVDHTASVREFRAVDFGRCRS